MKASPTLAEPRGGTAGALRLERALSGAGSLADDRRADDALGLRGRGQAHDGLVDGLGPSARASTAKALASASARSRSRVPGIAGKPGRRTHRVVAGWRARRGPRRRAHGAHGRPPIAVGPRRGAPATFYIYLWHSIHNWQIYYSCNMLCVYFGILTVLSRERTSAKGDDGDAQHEYLAYLPQSSAKNVSDLSGELTPPPKNSISKIGR